MSDRYLPLYEAKMIHHFDHRWASCETVCVPKGKKSAGDLEARDATDAEKQDPEFVVQPRNWVSETEVDLKAAADAGWFIGFRDICRSTDVRTAIFGICPRSAVGNKFPLIRMRAPAMHAACLIANGASFILDFATRQKLGGTTLNFFITQQLPVLPLATYLAPCSWHPKQPLAA